MDNTARLDPRVVDQLAKICGLLDSNQDGERAAAAWQASRILFEHGLTWRELVQAAGAQRPIHFEPHPDWRRQVEACLAVPRRMTGWELEFLDRLARYQRQPSDKQLRLLRELHNKATMP